MLIHTLTRNNVIPTWLSTRRYHLNQTKRIPRKDWPQKCLSAPAIHPSNYNATGSAWRFRGDKTLTYQYDYALPFGASKSPDIFHRLTRAKTRMMNHRGFTVLAYLDDFLIVSDTAVECQLAYQALIKLLSELYSGLKLIGIGLLGLVSDWHFLALALTSAPCAGNSHCPNANSESCDCYLGKQLQSDLSQNDT